MNNNIIVSKEYINENREHDREKKKKDGTHPNAIGYDRVYRRNELTQKPLLTVGFTR